MRRLILVLAAFACIAPTRANGQRTAMWRDSAQLYTAATKALRDSMMTGDSTVSEVARSGDLTVAASVDQHDQAAAHLAALTRMRERWFGNALPDASGFRITLHIGEETGRGSSSHNQRYGTVVVAGTPDTGSAIRRERTVDGKVVDNVLLDYYAEFMIASVTNLSKWITSPPPASMPDAERRELAMYGFATGMGEMQRKCVGGDLTACRYALDIEHAPASETGATFPVFTHADFLYYTLDLGGTGAWERLRDSSKISLSDGLAAAAKMPIDSLIAKWRVDLLALRPTTSTVSLSSALVAITWIALLIAGTLGASRWG